MPTPDSPPSDAIASKPRRRWLRVSLRGLMVLILLIGGGLGWLVHSARTQRDAVAAIQRSGQVSYVWDCPPGSFLNPRGRTLPPRWLADRLGPDALGSVVAVNLINRPDDPAMGQVARLPGLKSFACFFPRLITDAQAVRLGDLAQLEEVDLPCYAGEHKLTGAMLARFDRLTLLRRLRLDNIPIRDAELAPLDGLTRLNDLQLDGCGIDDAGLAHLAGLVHLAVLGLNGTKVTAAGLVNLRQLAGLRGLGLGQTGVDDLRPIAGLTQLRWISLESCPITDAGLAPVAGWPDLGGIDLDRTTITDAGLAHLAGLGKLSDLGLRRTAITDAGLARLAGLTRLTDLDLGETAVTDKGIAPLLAGNPALVTLNLARTAVTDASLAPLAGLARLDRLDLARTGVTDAGLAHLAPISSLTDLDLSGTAVTDAGLDRLDGLTGLKRLGIARTAITPAWQARFARVHPSVRIEDGRPIDPASLPPGVGIPASPPSEF